MVLSQNGHSLFGQIDRSESGTGILPPYFLVEILLYACDLYEFLSLSHGHNVWGMNSRTQLALFACDELAFTLLDVVEQQLRLNLDRCGT